MKEKIQTAALFAVFMALIPCLAFVGRTRGAALEEFTVGVYFREEDKVEKYSVEDYVIGAVLAQMPADFEDEALKAQAVLARTYIYRRMESEKSSPTEALHGALISDDDTMYQGFFTLEQAKAFYGGEFDRAYEKVKAAVGSAEGILTYNGQPVIAAYHAASSGYTESALTAWGQDIPYLQAVASTLESGDECIETVTSISAKELQGKLEDKYEIDLSGDLSSCLETQTNERGYVTSVNLCSQEIPVGEFTDTIGIVSPCFEFEVQKNGFIFTSKGFGHLVGMSQYGADLMAKQGMNYEEILKSYFVDCEVFEK